MPDLSSDTQFFDTFEEVGKIYSESDFLNFAEALGETRSASTELIKDVLCCAGAQYLMFRQQTAQEVSNKEMLRELNKVANSARRLEKSLNSFLPHGLLRTNFEKSIQTQKEKSVSTGTPDEELLRYIANNPISKIQSIAEFAGQAALQYNAKNIPKKPTDKSEALRLWVDIVALLWAEQSLEYPATGHYYKELGDYKSKAISTMTFVINKIDKTVTSRTVVSAISAHRRDAISENRFDGLVGVFFGGIHLFRLLKSGKNSSSFEEFANFLEIPPEYACAIRESKESEWLEKQIRSLKDG